MNESVNASNESVMNGSVDANINGGVMNQWMDQVNASNE